jgi:hypothetical protein
LGKEKDIKSWEIVECKKGICGFLKREIVVKKENS